MKKLALTLTLTVSIAPQTYAMQPAVGRTSGQFATHYAKKVISGSMTTLHWTLAAGQSIATGIQRIQVLSDEKKALKHDRCTDASEDVTQFINTELKKITPDQLEGIKINPQLSKLNQISTLKKHIMIAQSTADEISTALKNNDEKTLNKWRSALEHEETHIDNNDLYWRTAIDMLMPFVTHGSVKAIRGALPFAQKTRHFWKEQLIKIPTALGKSQITLRTRKAIYREQEYRADNGVSNNEDSLNGMKDFLNDAEKTQRLVNIHLSDQQYRRTMWAMHFIQDHPLNEKRIEKIDQRIAALQKQNNENQN